MDLKQIIALTSAAVIAAAGVAVTPGGCAEVLLLLGKDESMRRLNEAFKRLG